MRLVVIEKWEGPCWFECLANSTAAQPPRPCDPSCGEEDYQLATIKRIKARNPGVATVFYLNTLYNFPYYKLAGAFAAARENVLGTDGKPINLINDDGMKHIEIMDFGQPSAIKRYLDFHRGLVDSGLVDGTFPDKNGIRASKNATSGQWQLCEMNGGAAFGHSWSDACGEISEATALACALSLPCMPAPPYTCLGAQLSLAHVVLQSAVVDRPRQQGEGLDAQAALRAVRPHCARLLQRADLHRYARDRWLEPN